MLSKKNRIANKRLIAKLLRQGNIYKSSAFVFRYLPALEGSSRFAVIASKKVAKKAVERNRIRRQASALMQGHLAYIPKPIVALIMPRALEKPASYLQMEQSLIDFFSRFSKPGQP